MKRASLALLLCLLLLLVSPTSLASARAGVLRVPLHRTPKTLDEYLTHAGHERQTRSTTSGSPWRQPVATGNSDYYAHVTVGTPPQSFTVLLKTDAGGMWIPSAMCPTQTYDVCKNHQRYQRDRSSTYVREGQAMGYGGMVAELSYDTVTLGGSSVTGQSFAEVFQYNYNDNSFPYDGLLGLDIVQHVFSNDASIFRNMESQGLIDQIVYGLYYGKNASDPTDAGGLIIGGRDPSLYEGKLTYLPSMYDVMWQFAVKEVMLLASPDMPSLCPGGCTAVPGSGSHFIISSQAAMDTLHKHLGATAFLGDHTYHFDCNSLEKLQPVYFLIEGAFLKLPWQSYVDKVMDATGNVVCLSSFVGTYDVTGPLGTGNGFYLGDAFFNSIYVEFDPDNQRMGFAQSKYSH